MFKWRKSMDTPSKIAAEAAVAGLTVNLGWANGWPETPAVVTRCRELKHTPYDRDEGPEFRGIKNHVICKECGYEYWYDSSD